MGGVRSSPFDPPARLFLHLASSSLTPAGDSVVRMYEEMVCCHVCGCLQRVHSGDGCDLALTLCKYDLRNADLFVLSWARVRRMRWGSISSELLMCSGGMHSILLLPLLARCLEIIDICIWHMFVFMSVVVSV